jgi:hypothetical protein
LHREISRKEIASCQPLSYSIGITFGYDGAKPKTIDMRRFKYGGTLIWPENGEAGEIDDHAVVAVS